MRYTDRIKSIHERILERLAPGPGHWPWPGALNSRGLPVIGFHGAQISVARELWALWNEREVPAGSVVVNACGCRVCVRPSHLMILSKRHLHTRKGFFR